MITQLTAWRFKCRRCRSIYRVSAPSHLLLLAAVPGIAGLVALACVTLYYFGLLTAGPCLAFMAIGWIADDVLEHRCITCYCRFIETEERPDSSRDHTSENVSAATQDQKQ